MAEFVTENALPPSMPRQKRGRKPGWRSPRTIQVREALIEAFDRLGGVESLAKWGKENPTEFYKLWVKILPIQVLGKLDNSGPPVRLTVIERVVSAVADRTGDESLSPPSHPLAGEVIDAEIPA